MAKPSPNLSQTVARETARVVELSEQDGSARIAVYRGWTVRDLVIHLGLIQRWAADVLRQRSTSRPPRRTDAPPHGASVSAWFAAIGRELGDALARVPVETPMWSVNGDHRARGWQLRMACETTLHRWDIEHALSVPHVPIRAAVAACCLEEAVDLHLARPLARTRGAGGRVTLSATDVARSWEVDMAATGIQVTPLPRHAADTESGSAALVAGDSERLWLWIDRRLSGDAVERQGAETPVRRLEALLRTVRQPVREWVG